jgi:putative nucleotidyltransferase with HDIG domain
MRKEVERIWPEIEWIEDVSLKEKVLATWLLAFERSPLLPSDLERIPFTLLVKDCQATFMEHKRCVVHIARESATAMSQFLGQSRPTGGQASGLLRIDMDTVIAGAILADVGKLLEYEIVDGEARQSARGRLLRHPFTGVSLAMECGVPDEICHIIAAHAKEGDLVKRSVEATIVHHADFMSFLPFKNLA